MAKIILTYLCPILNEDSTKNTREVLTRFDEEGNLAGIICEGYDPKEMGCKFRSKNFYNGKSAISKYSPCICTKWQEIPKSE